MLKKSMWMSRMPLFIILFSILLAGHVAAEPSGDMIKILSISPDPSHPLEAGKSYEFVVTAEYDFKQDKGGMVLGINRGNCYTLNCVLANIIEPIAKGKGTLTLKGTVVVPDTHSISVGTSLFKVGEAHTSAEEYISYNVIGATDGPTNQESYVQPALSGERIKILSISPDESTPLHVGKDYIIEVDGEYVLTKDKGDIALVIQRGDQYASSGPLANISEPITKGNHKFTLKTNITVPDTSSIMVITPLFSEESTSITDYKLYRVIKE